MWDQTACLFNENVMLSNEWVDVRGSNPVTGAFYWKDMGFGKTGK
jgi:hypothetical protein